MPAIRTLSESLDNLYTTTWQNMKGTAQDQIFDATPFWFWLKMNGGLQTEEGGRFLTVPLRYAKSDNVQFVRRGSSVALTDKEFLTVGDEQWRYMVDTIVRFGIDDQQNRGKNAIMSLMQSKLDNSKDSLIDTLETRLTGTAGTDQFLGLLDLVPDDPTGSGATLHGIDPSVYTWWRSQTFDMAGLALDTELIPNMNKMLNSCSNNRAQDTPDIIVTGKHPFEIYWENTLEQKRITNNTLGDAGFQNIEFRGVPMIWSPVIDSDDVTGTDGRMYFLNTRFIKFIYDPMLFFDMTRWKDIPSQVNDRTAQIILAGNMLTGRRRTHGVLEGLDTLS